MLSGVGPRRELEAAGVSCQLDAPDVGKHLKDHLQVGLFYEAPGLGVSMSQMGVSMGPDALRAPGGPLPADPADDADLPEGLQALKGEAQRRVAEWATTGHGLVASSLYEAGAWFSTGLGDDHTHDAQLVVFVCGYNDDIWHRCLRVDPAEYFDNPEERLGPDAESVIVLANPVQPHSEGEIVLTSGDPAMKLPRTSIATRSSSSLAPGSAPSWHVPIWCMASVCAARTAVSRRVTSCGWRTRC